ncbi:hypothetical protein FA15DRAFT_671477 [Coprinopsis marcescibilis]|uniref:non-specific serine/threonine protein kinase n=1 Tax=Coprinopsis marcescibilis TaxID=230819 RepID=A0A5C3KPR8_COPMA|nr:hypothetical protein FA15DRAFT_671477 [Coprinopsis marcescibilis]
MATSIGSSSGPPSHLSPSLVLLQSPTCKPISQGAEARVFKTYLSPPLPTAAAGFNAASPPQVSPILLKHRFKKAYRHEILDTALTKARVAGEARALLKCLRSGVNVPSILMVDAQEGMLGLEWIDGHSVRQLLPGGEEEEDDDPVTADSGEDPLTPYCIDADTITQLIGAQLAKLHKADIVHGDLTTSNMMVRRGRAGTEVVLIDFGLSFTSTLVEDKAVDLYVLERAFASTHPDSEPMFAKVLESYGKGLGQKEWGVVNKRLDEVRLRGRKRSMVG